MGNKLINIATKASLCLGFLFFVVTLSKYWFGSSVRELVYWSVLTLVMYAQHIIFRIGEVRGSVDEISDELADFKMMLMDESRQFELKELERLVEEADKLLEEEKKVKQ